MKLRTNENGVERSFEEGVQIVEGVAKIKASAKAYEILSRQLYSDGILAIVRELGCNAFDAHLAAGHPERPFEVHLPSPDEPSFIIKDYGIGLSQEDVTNLYLTFFESTKAEEEMPIGCLGLGCKTPWAYTRSFNIESRFNGTKTLYTAFKNEIGAPSIAVLHSEPTEEENGLTVTIAVQEKDIDRFHRAAQKAYLYFKVRPIITNPVDFKYFDLDYVIDTSDKWKIRDTSMRYLVGNNARIVQSMVAYPIDTSVFNDVKGLDRAAIGLLDLDLDLYVAPGVADVAPSREALSYDDETVRAIAEAAKVVADELHASFQQQFEECKSLYEATIKFTELYSYSGDALNEAFRNLHNTRKFTWNGTELDSHIAVDKALLAKIHLTVVTPNRRRGVLSHSVISSKLLDTHVDVGINDTTVIIADTHRTGRTGSLYNYMSANTSAKRIIMIRPVDATYGKTPDYQRALAELIKALGDAPYMMLDSIPGYPIPKRINTRSSGGATKEKLQLYAWDGFQMKRQRGWYSSERIHRKYSLSTWDAVDVDLEEGGFYVDTSNHAVLHPDGAMCMYMDSLVRLAIQWKVLEPDEHVYGISAADCKRLKIKTNDKWKNLFKTMQTVFNSQVKSNEDLLTASSLRQSDVPVDLINMLSNDKHVLNKLPSGSPFASYVTSIKRYAGERGEQLLDQASSLAQVGLMSTRTHARTHVIENEYRETIKRYPMLSCIAKSDTMSSTMRDTITDYVAMMDNLHKEQQNDNQ